jgi:hypothetical protein
VALLDGLAMALSPPPIEPSASELFALRTAVASHFKLVDTAPAACPTVRTPWWRRFMKSAGKR